MTNVVPEVLSFKLGSNLRVESHSAGCGCNSESKSEIFDVHHFKCSCFFDYIKTYAEFIYKAILVYNIIQLGHLSVYRDKNL